MDVFLDHLSSVSVDLQLQQPLLFGVRSPYLVNRGVLAIRVRGMSLTIYYLLSVNSTQI